MISTRKKESKKDDKIQIWMESWQLYDGVLWISKF